MTHNSVRLGIHWLGLCVVLLFVLTAAYAAGPTVTSMTPNTGVNKASVTSALVGTNFQNGRPIGLRVAGRW